MEPRIASLVSIYNLPGYQVIFEFLEAECATLERAVFETDPADDARVVAAHRVAVGARWAVTEAKKKIERTVSEAGGNAPPPLSREQEDEIYLRGLNT
jgi:hypothetical protein